MNLMRFVCLIFLWLVIKPGNAAIADYQISKADFDYQIEQYFALNSSESPLTINELLSVEDRRWQQHLNQIPMAKKGVNWFVHSITNSSNSSVDSYLVIPNSVLLAKINVYISGQDSDSQLLPMALHRNNVWVGKVTVPANQSIRLYYRLDTEYSIETPIVLMAADVFFEQLSQSYFNMGIAIGGLILLSFLAIVVFASNAYKTVMLLCFYFVTSALLLSVLLGGNLSFVWPYLPSLRGIEFPILVAANNLFFIWFSIELFSIKNQHKKIFNYLRKYCWVLLVFMPLSMLLSVINNIYISFSIHIFTNLVLLIVGTRFLKLGHRLAFLYSAIIMMQLLIALINVSSSQLSGVNFHSHMFNLYIVSFWLTASLICFLISRQYYFQVKDKQAIQQQALDAATATKIAQEELLTLQEETQEQLESRVQERTLELNIALQELEEANKELAEKNTTDDLTGLFNRRHYDQKILAEYRRSKRNLTPLSLIVVDIDHFKRVNDDYGHLTGDHCIATVGRLIKQCLRRSADLGFRYGGEEFCLILPETDTSGAKALAEELRVLVSNNPISYQEQQLEITISCGISTYQQQPSVDPDKLFAGADKALYVAKHNGRNQVQVEILNESITHQEQVNE